MMKVGVGTKGFVPTPPNSLSRLGGFRSLPGPWRIDRRDTITRARGDPLRMLKTAKQGSLHALRVARAFEVVARSRWRRNRLLILCYHGIAARQQEHWDGSLFLNATVFAARLQALADGGFRVLPLSEGLSRLATNTLPEKSVVLTFDDGLYSFYQVAWPILQRYQFPVTVYLTTYYCSYNRPIFDLICSYLLWQARGALYDGHGIAACAGPLDLRTPAARARVLCQLKGWAEQLELSGVGKDELAHELAEELGIDYNEIRRRRLLHLMNPDEVRELARAGVDFQLHTHHHRTPQQQDRFGEELAQNAHCITEWTGSTPEHFCFPNGTWHPCHLPWLQEWGVRSATTCAPGLASRHSSPWLLPRLVDHSALDPVEFEGWLAGVCGFDPRWRYRVFNATPDPPDRFPVSLRDFAQPVASGNPEPSEPEEEGRVNR
jgi:peptidoglycan/xylan/chitin deacetylase (PgdA/CDA1 family)